MSTETLIIVDMLNDFIDPKGALYCGPAAEAIVPAIAEKAAAFRQQGQPVIYLRDAHRPDDKEFAKFPPHCVEGTWGSRIIDALAPVAGDIVIPKTRYSGFYGTDLDGRLRKIQPRLVTVTGVCTSICVMDTVGGLANRDYTVQVYTNAVADFDEQMHRFALQRMEKIYGARIL